MIDAILTDEDDTIITDGSVNTTPDPTTLGYTWFRSKVADPEVDVEFHWTPLTDTGAATMSLYSALDADEDTYLRVRVYYTDAENAVTTDADSLKTAYAISYKAVRAAPAIGDNGSPDFGQPSDTRTVSESVAVGDNVGAPVTAADPDPEDTVTYFLEGGDDAAFFNVDRKTGQLTVAQKLDADAADAGEYVVVVRASDPYGSVAGSTDVITITITAEDANEAPEITGRAVFTVMEAPSYDDFPEATASANRYVAEQDETNDSIATWHLEGPDGGLFDLAGNFEPRWLNFMSAPDFENPKDENSDNVYEVTIVATDTDPLETGAEAGRISVAVVVLNVDEPGEVVFTEGDDAYVSEVLVAQVHDKDDHGGDLGEPYQGVHIVSWQWSSWNGVGTEDFQPIAGETTNRYTPSEDDQGLFLRVTATYTDPHSDPDLPNTMADERVATDDNPDTDDSLRTKSATTEFAVRLAPGPDSAPMFADADSNGAVTRDVAENTPSGDNVGVPVKASGPGTPTHTLGGADAKYFGIDGTSGQITVGDAPNDPMLDYEAAKNTYSVTVKAVGADNQSATVTVNILVTNINERPEVKDGEDTVAEGAVLTEEHAENDDGVVATYAATDPEGQTIRWDIRGADASFFTINSRGELSFASPPNYENHRDRAAENTATDGVTDVNQNADDGTYSVLLRAVASRTSGTIGPAQAASFFVNVEVTNVDEPGTIELLRLQPEVDSTDPATDTAIAPTLTDPDGLNGRNVTWVWTVSKVSTGSLDIDNEDHWNPAPGATSGTDSSYTPVLADLDRFLRVTAMYEDAAATDTDDPPNGDDGDTVRFMMRYAVQAAAGGLENQSPDFVDGTVERSVEENVRVGENVGAPVTASVVAVSSTDRLTYRLRAATPDDINAVTGVTLPVDPTPAEDAAAFAIDQATGQITVAQSLDFESRGPTDPLVDRDGKYVVVVEVVDPSGEDDFVVVIITASDVNDNPVLSGRPELTINEDEKDAFVGSDSDSALNFYNLKDEDRHSGNASWSLTGEDADDFQLIGTGGRTLVFKPARDAPDFENPADYDMDNVYKVTIVVIDNNGGRGTFDVCVDVLNINEPGKIALVDSNGNAVTQPNANRRITAELTDEDGDVIVEAWRWYSEDLLTDFADVTVLIPVQTVELTEDGAHLALSSSYTPDNDDTGNFLHVEATYTDQLSAGNDPGRTAAATTDNAVLEGQALGEPPVFGMDGVGIDSVSREVAENSPAGSYVGVPLPAATDPDNEDAVLVYTLEDVKDGDDAKFFALRHAGQSVSETIDTLQLMVNVPALRDGTGGTTNVPPAYDPVDLDYEIDPDDEDDKNTFTIVLKAAESDSANAPNDTLTVTITVTDRNEAPSTPAAAKEDATTDDNNAPEFAATTATRTVAVGTAADENIGVPITATDADDDTLTYTLGGADASSFGIDPASGQLQTTAASEALAEGSYEVTVTARDGRGGDATVDVTITVVAAGSGTLLERYDTNPTDGIIDINEALVAIGDFFARPPQLSIGEALEVVALYFEGLRLN